MTCPGWTECISQESEDSYAAAIQISPHSEFADKAREGSNLLAQSGFDRVRQVMPRRDAVHYCLDALQRFTKLSPVELQRLPLELAMAGRDGFAVHDPDSRYRVKGLDDEFSGLAMVCFLYVAMQHLAPGTDIGFDVAAECEEERGLFTAASRKTRIGHHCSKGVLSHPHKTNSMAEP